MRAKVLAKRRASSAPTRAQHAGKTSAKMFGAMLSPKIQYNLSNAKSYFSEHLSVGDYYAEHDRNRGEWLGQGAAKLGLSGAVTQDQFVAL